MPQFLPAPLCEGSMVDTSSSLTFGAAKYIMLQSSTWAENIPQPDLADSKQAWVLPLYSAVWNEDRAWGQDQARVSGCMANQGSSGHTES